MRHKRQFQKNSNSGNWKRNRQYHGNRQKQYNDFEREEPYRILVHNLPADTEADHLQAFLHENLKKIHFTAFKLFDTFAYFTVANRDLCNKAFELLQKQQYRNNQLVLLKDKLSDDDINSKYGWKVLVAEKRGSTLFTGRTRKVFVGNLPYRINAGEVRDFFTKKCGPVDDFRMSRGCCFIRFVDAKPSVHLALDYHGKRVFGRKIRVEEELDDQDRPNQKLRHKKKPHQQQPQEEEPQHQQEQQDNQKESDSKSSDKAPEEEKSESNNDGPEEDNTIEVTEQTSSRGGPKFLSEEEVKKRDFHFEPTESLFPKKKRRKKLQKKLESAAASKNVEYVNEDGSKSFVHQKKKKQDTKDDIPFDELFVPQAPEKIRRRDASGKVKVEIRPSASAPALEEEESSFATQEKSKKRKRNHSDEGREASFSRNNKKQKKNQQRDGSNSRHRSNHFESTENTWESTRTNPLYDGEGPTEYERKHGLDKKKKPKPPHKWDIVFKDPPKTFKWSNE